MTALLAALCLAACGNTPSSGAASSSSGASPQAETADDSRATSAKLGSEPLALIVVGFAGDENGENAVPYRDDFDWHAMAFKSDQGVTAFYSDQSIGAFTWTPAHETSAFGADGNTCTADAQDDGIVHVVLPRGHGHWFASDKADGPQGTIGIDEVTEEQAAAGADFNACAVEALREAAKYIDFASYDKNGNSAIDSDELGVGIIFAGYDLNGDWMSMLDESVYPSMQAHSGGPFDVGINFGSNTIPNQAIIMGEMMTRVPGDRTADEQVDESVIESVAVPLSTLDHELGHYLNLPDYYDTSYDETAPWAHWTAGSLSTMDNGAVLPVSTGDNTYEYMASRLDPLSRIMLGWLRPQIVDASGTYEVRADGAAGGKNVLLVMTDKENEYFLIENRQPTGFDAVLQDQDAQTKAGGIVVWHVDANVYDDYFDANQVNLPLHHPALTVQYLLSRGDASASGLPESEPRHTLSFADSVAPDTASAFWDRSSAQSRFAELGVDALQLWTYGEGDSADDPHAREYCGIYLTFPDESADIMRVEVAFR